jgi:tetratricopeptide (TPR) repeat protein
MNIQRTLVLLVAAAALAAPALSQQTELSLFTAVTQERDPAKKLALLTEWTAKFPKSTYARERNLHYLSVYSQLETAAILPSASPEALTLGERAANVIATRADELFSPEMLPESVSTANRTLAKTEALRQAFFTTGLIAVNRKDFARAETAWRSLAAISPEDGSVALRLGTSIVSQRNPGRYPEAIYYLARAASQMQPGTDRDAATQYLRTVYRTWHGDLSELDETIAAAVVSKTLPVDWKIPSAAEVANVREIERKAWEDTHPELAFWRKLRIRLGEPDAMEYFAAELKDAMLPRLKGAITATPAAKEVVLAMDGEKPEVTLRLDAAAKQKLIPGTVVAFVGSPQTLRLKPYMLVIDVKATDLELTTP